MGLSQMDLSAVVSWGVQLVCAWPLSSLACVCMYQLVGMLWFSEGLFGTAWMREAFRGRSAKEIEAFKTDPAPFAVAWISAFFLMLMLKAAHMYLMGETGGDWKDHVALGVTMAMLSATCESVHVAFANRSFKLWLINAAHAAVALSLMSVAMGVLRPDGEAATGTGSEEAATAPAAGL